MRKIVAISVSTIVVIAVVLILMRNSDREKVLPTQLTSPTLGTITKSVIATVEIRPLAIADVKPKIGGVLRRFFVDEGQHVKKGQRLAEVVPSASPSELVAARERVELARLDMELSERRLKEAEKLAQMSLISEKSLYEANIQAEMDRKRYEAALAELRILEESVFSQSDSKAQIRDAQEEMIIVSPIDGIVLWRNVDEGSSVIPISSAYGGTSILTLADVSVMHFEGEVDESDIGKIQVGMPARVHVDAFPDTVFKGVLTRVAPAAAKREGLVSFRVEVEIIGDTSLLKTGMSADAELIVEERSGILTLPEAAIIYEGESTFVEVFDPKKGTKQKVSVKIGISDGIKTEIIEGVDESSKVVMQ